MGDVFIRELDVSQLTLRITAKSESKAEDKDDHIIAKLTGDTLSTLKQCLVRFPQSIRLAMLAANIPYPYSINQLL